MFRPDIKPIKVGFSFFGFINSYCLEESRNVQESVQINRALHRLCDLMRKMEAKTVILEEYNGELEDINDEKKALDVFFSDSVEVKAYRFSFLDMEVRDSREVLALPDDSLLSNTILINFRVPPKKQWKSYIFQSIVAIPRTIKSGQKIPILNNFLKIYNTFTGKVRLDGGLERDFKITGSFFCQQNEFTSTCAHASLSMTLNNCLKDSEIVTSEHINRILGIDHNKVKMGTNRECGLDTDEIKSVLTAFKLPHTSISFFEEPGIEYNEYVYKYIESKCPVLLGLTTSDSYHIVTVLGHTLNTDLWKPEAEEAYQGSMNNLNYKPVSSWVDHFIISDDNFGVYLCLPVDSLKRVTSPKTDPSFRARSAIAIIPQGVTTPSWEAEWSSVSLFKHTLRQIEQQSIKLDVWTERILDSDNSETQRPIVVRTILVSKEDYEENLRTTDFNGRSFSGPEMTLLMKELPDRFWLSEITLPDLYTVNRTKLVDVLYSCSDGPLNVDDENVGTEISNRCIQIRFPSMLYRKDNLYFISEKSHFPLLRFRSEKDIEIFIW